MAQGVFLESSRLYLRSLQPTDADGDYPDWLNDADVCRYNSHHVFPYSATKARAYIASVVDSTNCIVLAIVARDTDRHVGNISLQRIDPHNQNAEFAVLVGAKDYWGQGFSLEAGRLLMKHGFLRLNLARIYCGTSDENDKMIRLARRLGMTEEGRDRRAVFQNGRLMDIVRFGILREEFTEEVEMVVDVQQS